jgi:two-component system nitrogen regulation sensor histidine kinase NtrY
LTTPGKIRLLLVLLCASLLFTAIIVQNTYTPLNSLRQTAKILEDNLHKKEGYVNEQLNNTNNFKQLKNLPNDPQLALKFIEDYTNDKKIWFITLNRGALSFWTGIKIIPENLALIKNGYSFITAANGYYEAIKKTEGDFSAIFFIPVKINYAFQNQYLKNAFAADLITDKNVEIADFTDKAVYEVRSTNHDYLFSVKLKPGEVNHRFFYYELTCWILALISLCVLVQNISTYIANKGYVFLSVLLLVTFIVILRLINLHYDWPDFTYKVDIFNPRLYGSSFLFPSLGDLCVNILFLCWLSAFLYKLRHLFLKQVPRKPAGYLIFIAGIFILVVTSTALLNIFNGLVINSKINFDVSNLLNLSAFSLLGVLMLCFSFLTFYLLIEVFLTIAQKLPIPDSHKAYIFITCIILTTAVVSYRYQFTLFYLLWAALVFIRAQAHKYNSAKINAVSFGGIVVICALISSIKLNTFESVKEKATRMALIQKLEVPDDAAADLIFKKTENLLIADPAIFQYFKDSLYNSDYLKNRFQKLYFDGPLSRYEFNLHVFNKAGQPISAERNYSLAIFKEMVLYGSLKVSNYFYRENESFGFQNYFAIIPVIKNEQPLGTIIIELKSKKGQLSGAFPELLIDGQTAFENEFKDYSYAFYIDDKLLSQSGSYVYNIKNTEFKGELKKYVFQKDHSPGSQWYMGLKAYSHLIYKPGKRNLLVVSKEENILLWYNIHYLLFCCHPGIWCYFITDKVAVAAGENTID